MEEVHDHRLTTMLHEGRRPNILTLMQKKGQDITDPIKALKEYHDAKKEERKEDAKQRAAKRKASKAMDDDCKATGKAKAKAKAKAKGKGKPKPEPPTHGGRFYEVRKVHAKTGKNPRIYFMGKPTMESKPTLILECTEAKCAMWGKCYRMIGEYMWVMLQDDMLTNEEARNGFAASLNGQFEG